jgi:hypothetical protein
MHQSRWRLKDGFLIRFAPNPHNEAWISNRGTRDRMEVGRDDRQPRSRLNALEDSNVSGRR